tara:strand:+ start:524 stop:697 length:174 start_codon:yes stop_codon:yes gene_type:complete
MSSFICKLKSIFVRKFFQGAWYRFELSRINQDSTGAFSEAQNGMVVYPELPHIKPKI